MLLIFAPADPTIDPFDLFRVFVPQGLEKRCRFQLLDLEYHIYNEVDGARPDPVIHQAGAGAGAGAGA